jgi:acyl-coenzyme A thioesterase PaaI-like protein
MNPGLWRVVERADALSPELSRRLIGTFLRLASPFNAPLHASIDVWRETQVRIRVPNRRGLRNHLGGVHAGALVTAGETPAGLLVLRNFPFHRYRLILKNLSASYEKQARSALVAEATATKAAIAAAREGLENGTPQLLEIKTVISDEGGTRLAVIKSEWQVKSWSQVKQRR